MELRSRNAFETLGGLDEEGMPKEKESDAHPTKAPILAEEVEAQ